MTKWIWEAGPANKGVIDYKEYDTADEVIHDNVNSLDYGDFVVMVTYDECSETAYGDCVADMTRECVESVLEQLEDE